jgi:hypothetical protein
MFSSCLVTVGLFSTGSGSFAILILAFSLLLLLEISSSNHYDLLALSYLVFLQCVLCHWLAYSSSSVFLAWDGWGRLKAEWWEGRKG